MCFTINNYTDQDQLDLKGNDKIKYLIYGFEVGENGTPHLQGYLEIEKRCEITWYKKNIHKTAHFEPRRGSLEQAVNYCKKDGNFYEQGEAKVSNQGKRSDITLVKEIIKGGGTINDVIEVATSYQSIRTGEILLKYRAPLKEEYERKVYWFYGPTGAGKTRVAYEEARKIEKEPWMSHDSLKWFDGYSSQKAVIIDDFRTNMISFNFLLRILDRYPVRVPIKGSYTPWEAEYIWITSHKGPEELYTWEGNLREDIGQLLRRIDKVVNFGIQMEVDRMFDPPSEDSIIDEDQDQNTMVDAGGVMINPKDLNNQY